MTDDIITRLSDEADQCRNDGADDIAGLLDDARAQIESLKRDVHNLNWALGADGYDQMATQEEQAAADAGHQRAIDMIEHMKARKTRHDALLPDGRDPLDEIERLRAECENWRNTVWAVGRALNCLPSTFSGANGHILKAADKLDAECERLRAECEARIEEAFKEGFCYPQTYNDTVLNTPDEAWGEAKEGLLREIRPKNQDTPTDSHVDDVLRAHGFPQILKE